MSPTNFFYCQRQNRPNVVLLWGFRLSILLLWNIYRFVFFSNFSTFRQSSWYYLTSRIFYLISHHSLFFQRIASVSVTKCFLCDSFHSPNGSLILKKIHFSLSNKSPTNRDFFGLKIIYFESYLIKPQYNQ